MKSRETEYLPGGRVARVQELLSDLNPLVMETVDLICKLLSVYLFVSLNLQFWETGPDILLRLWKPLAVCIGLNLVFFAVKIAVTSFRLKVGAGGLIRKNLPAMLVGYATASSAAEALAISATLGVLMDFICTGTKIGIMHLELALQADRLGILDMEILRKSEG